MGALKTGGEKPRHNAFRRGTLHSCPQYRGGDKPRPYSRQEAPMIAVLGASGNTGKVIAETLLARGEKIRAIGRDPNRLAPLVQKGAEAFAADASDEAALTKAFAGARAVYAMIPPNLKAEDLRAYQERISDAQSRAIEKAGVEYAVVLSSIGADKPDKTGPVVGLHMFEQKLNSNSRLNALY